MDDYFPFAFLLRLSSGLRCRIEVSEITTGLLSLTASCAHIRKNGVFTAARSRATRSAKYLRASFNRLPRNIRLYRYGGFVRRQQPPRTLSKIMRCNAGMSSHETSNIIVQNISGREPGVVINTLPENTLLLRFVSDKMNYHRQLLSSEIRQERSEAR